MEDRLLEEQEIRLDEVFNSLKKRWIMIVSLTLIAAIISATISFFVIKPKYEATTKIFIGKDESESTAYNQSDVAMLQNLLKTYSEVIRTKDLIKDSIDDSNLDLEVNEVLGNLSVTSIASTQIMTLSYKSTDPEEAKVILEKITKNFTEESTDLIKNVNIKVVETVEYPKSPVSPNKTMNIAIAGILGLMLGVGISLLIEFLDNTYKNKEQIERELELPVLGMIPESKGM